MHFGAESVGSPSVSFYDISNPPSLSRPFVVAFYEFKEESVMDTIQAKLTVFFEDPFWIGLFERIEGEYFSICKVTFGK